MSNTRDRATPVGGTLICKRVIKQENVDHRARMFNGPIRLSQRMKEQKSRHFFIQLDGEAATSVSIVRS